MQEDKKADIKFGEKTTTWIHLHYPDIILGTNRSLIQIKVQNRQH